MSATAIPDPLFRILRKFFFLDGRSIQLAPAKVTLFEGHPSVMPFRWDAFDGLACLAMFPSDHAEPRRLKAFCDIEMIRELQDQTNPSMARKPT
jgi:hypothetical protein